MTSSSFEAQIKLTRSRSTCNLVFIVLCRQHSTTNYSSCNPTSMHISKNQPTSVKVSETIDDVTKIAATVIVAAN